MKDRLRDFLTHQGSLWLAVEVLSEAPRRFGLILLRKNTKDLSDKRDWISAGDLALLIPGLNKSLLMLQALLVKEIDKTSVASAD